MILHLFYILCTCASVKIEILLYVLIKFYNSSASHRLQFKREILSFTFLSFYLFISFLHSSIFFFFLVSLPDINLISLKSVTPLTLIQSLMLPRKSVLPRFLSLLHIICLFLYWFVSWPYQCITQNNNQASFF